MEATVLSPKSRALIESFVRGHEDMTPEQAALFFIRVGYSTCQADRANAGENFFAGVGSVPYSQKGACRG